MATLKKLSVQGVRSVGPGEEDRVVVKFFRPFTLITGDNGAGKTTIIESLKYASTGTLPPGSKTNAGWIHHPKQTSANLKRKKDGKIIQSGKVLSHITLEFESANNDGKGHKNILVRRSLEGSLKPTGGMSMKTMEGKITVTNAKTKIEESSRSEKLEDLNQSVRRYLSISKPILEYVIFCHQEDSLWPFEDSKKLKEKFDDIFQSSEYVKVMAQLKKERKTQQDHYRDSKKDTEKYKIYVTQREECIETVSTYEAEIAKHDEEISTASKGLQPHKDKISELGIRQSKFRTSHDAYQATKRRLDEVKSDILALENKDDQIARLADQYDVDIEKITEAIESCKKGEDRKKLEDKISELDVKKLSKNADLDQLLTELSNRTEDRNAYHRELDTRNVEFAKYGRKFQIQVDQQNVTDEICDEIFAKFSDRLGEIDAEKATMGQDFSEKLEKSESQKSKVQADRAGFDAEMKFKKRRIEEILSEESELNSIIENASQNSAKFNRMKKKENIISEEYQKVDWEEKGNQIDKNINKRNSQKDEAAQRIEELEAEEENSKMKQDKENELKLKQSELNEIDGKVGTLQDRLENDLETLPEYPNSLESISMSDISKWKENYQKKLSNSTKNFETISSKLAEKEAESKTQSKQLAGVRRDLWEEREKIENECLSDLETEKSNLESFNTERDEIQEKLSAMEEGKRLFKQFMRTIRAKKCCPLCETSLKERAQIERAQKVCQENLEFKNKGQMEIERDELSEKIAKLEKNVKILENIEILENREKDLEKTVSALKRDLVKFREEKQNLLKIQKDLKNKNDAIDIQTFSNFREFKQKFDERTTQVAKIEKHLEKVKNAPDYNNLREELRNKKSSKRELESSLDTLQTERRSLDSKQRNLNQQLQTVREELNRLQQCLGDDTDTINTKIEKLREERKSLKTEISVLVEKINKSTSELKTAERAIMSLKRDQLEDTKKSNENSEKIKTKFNLLQQTKKNFEQRFGQMDIEGLNDEIRECEKKKESFKAQIDAISKQILEFSSKRSTFSIRENNLKDALELSKKQKIRETVLAQFRAQKDELKSFMAAGSGLNAEDINKEILKETEKLQEKEKWLYSIKGRQEEKIKQLESEKARLNRKDIAEALINYKASFIKEIVEKHVVEDIDKYHSALDQAIMTIHQEKMSRLNSVIGHLWKGTYQGADIETIFVNAESDGPKATTAANARRTFDYNVVMKRTDGATLNMRGRASAGQRVLASLIIRLALAECFSDCGILALDEPTTNLDRRNIKKFAQMLGELAHNASHQLRTQFIIITHDSEFVEQLCQFGSIETYYHVTKNDKGYSNVRARGTSAAVENIREYSMESDEEN